MAHHGQDEATSLWKVSKHLHETIISPQNNQQIQEIEQRMSSLYFYECIGAVSASHPREIISVDIVPTMTYIVYVRCCFLRADRSMSSVFYFHSVRHSAFQRDMCKIA